MRNQESIKIAKNLSKCFYCDHEYPVPVELHHDKEECLRNREAAERRNAHAS